MKIRRKAHHHPGFLFALIGVVAGTGGGTGGGDAGVGGGSGGGVGGGTGGGVGGGGGTLPTGTPAADEVRVNETVRLQTLDGVGTNAFAFPYANDFGYVWTNVRDVFDEIDVAYVRVASWFGHWEPTNDDGDPRTTNWAAFDPLGIIGGHDVGFARFLTSKGIGAELGVWAPGEFMVQDGQIPFAMYPELGESIAT